MTTTKDLFAFLLAQRTNRTTVQNGERAKQNRSSGCRYEDTKNKVILHSSLSCPLSSALRVAIAIHILPYTYYIIVISVQTSFYGFDRKTTLIYWIPPIPKAVHVRMHLVGAHKNTDTSSFTIPIRSIPRRVQFWRAQTKADVSQHQEDSRY